MAAERTLVTPPPASLPGEAAGEGSIFILHAAPASSSAQARTVPSAPAKGEAVTADGEDEAAAGDAPECLSVLACAR